MAKLPAEVREFQDAICEAFGLDPYNVADIDLSIRAGAIPTASVKLFVREGNAGKLAAVLRKYRFAEVEGDAGETETDNPLTGGASEPAPEPSAAPAHRPVFMVSNTDDDEGFIQVG